MLIRYRPIGTDHEELQPLELCSTIVCLGLYFGQQDIDVNILDEWARPMLVNFELFHLLDGRIPPEWCMRYTDFDTRIIPQEFTGDFWDSYHDGDSDAEETFKEVVNKIYAFHGLPPRFVEEEKDPEPLQEHEWWKEYLDEDER